MPTLAPRRARAAVALAMTALVLTAAAPLPASAQGLLTSERLGGRRMDRATAAALERLKAMSDVLGQARGFSVVVTSLFDEPTAGGLAIKRLSRHTIKLKRPNKLAFEAELDDGTTRLGWFDGRTFTVATPATRSYFELPTEGTVDELVSAVESRGLGLPVTDFLYTDVFGALGRFLIAGADLGERRIGADVTRQLGFESLASNWQLWISVGSRPLPERFVAVYVRQLGDPEYVATFSDWSLEAPADGEFTPRIEADWRKVPPPGTNGTVAPPVPLPGAN
jgi:hypothetical protein